MTTTLPKDSALRVCHALNQIKEAYYDYKACWNKFNEFRSDGVLCDVVIKCKNLTYNAHKCVLSVASPYFQALFTTQMAVEANGQTIDLSEYSSTTVELLLDFMYATGNAEDADVGELLRLAEFLQYDWLVNALIKSIRMLIDQSNCYMWYEVAKFCGVKKLINIIKSFIMSSFDELIAMEEYGDIVPEIEDIVRTKEVEFEKEMVFVYHEMDSKNHIIDFTDKTLKMRREGPTLTACDSSVQLFLVHKHRLLMISTFNTYERSCPYYSREYFEHNTKVEVQAYNHCLRNYKLVHYIEPCKLVAMVHQANTAEVSRPNTPFKISSFAYNNIESLYMVLVDKNDIFTVFKFNLNDGCWADNWISFKPESKKLKLCESKHFGSLLIDGPHDVYDVEKFPFHQLNDHSPQPLNVSFDWKLIFKKAHNKRSNIKWNDKLWRWWEAVSLKGEVFLFVVFHCDSAKIYVYQLNPETVSWDELFAMDIQHLVKLGKVLVCGDDLYCFVFLHKDKVSDEQCSKSTTATQCLYRVDFSRQTCHNTGVDVSSLKETHRHAAVPAYFML